jgi:hypothetical protein
VARSLNLLESQIFATTYRSAKISGARMNRKRRSGNQTTWGREVRWELAMTLFSFVFTAVFLTFVIAAIIGHALLIEALVRPFFARLALARAPLLTRSRVLTAL